MNLVLYDAIVLHKRSNVIDCFGNSVQNYETTEHRIKREFEAYGPIKRVSIFE